MSGNSSRHGTHHVAQKLTSTTRPFSRPIRSDNPFASTSPARSSDDRVTGRSGEGKAAAQLALATRKRAARAVPFHRGIPGAVLFTTHNSQLTTHKSPITNLFRLS